MSTSMRSPPTAPLPVVADLAPWRVSRGVIFGAVLLTVCGLVAAFRQQQWEYPLVRSLNTLAGHSALFDRTVHALTARDLLEGVIFVALLCFLWFGTVDTNVRGRLLVGTAAAALSGMLSRLLQIALPTHLRPLHTSVLGFISPAGVEPDALNHFNAFPSDHGAVYFGLALVIYQQSRRLGLAAFAWAMIVNLARVYDGYHYPSDVFGSIGA
jgi:undecaprenyl-diphosphatase